MKTIYDRLGIDQNLIFNFDHNVSTLDLPQRMQKSLLAINPSSILIFNNKPIILFFHKDDNKEQIFRKCWNFGEAPIVIIETETDFEIYNGFEYTLKERNFSLSPLEINKLNYLSIISGKYFAESTFKQNNNRIDKKLLENIKYARKKLLDNGLKEYKDIANSLIGRIIFIRYLTDRKVQLKFENISKVLTNEDLKNILSNRTRTYELFRYLTLNGGFNGDWFPIDEINENKLVMQKHLDTLKELISGTEINTGQQSLFDYYDFSIIPIEFISNVYESFIGEEEQKSNGAYYTPTFLVDYVLKHTVDEYFKSNPKEYNCKVLDPACGSGIFLVETFRKLVTQFEKVTNKKIEQKEIIQIATDNIFGIDKDKSAVQISIFSLYLTMLDYQEPKDIEQFKFPYLLKSEKNPNANFFQSDFFNTDSECNQSLKDKKLDFIIGNPPYGRGTVNQSKYALEYIKNEKIKIGNQDIVQPFMIRVKDFVSQNTKIGFVVTSKVLYNLQTEEFRTKHFFNNFKMNHILELSSVRKEIFENADVPVSIIFYEKSTKEEIANNIIKYISMKPNRHFEKLKILILTKNDFKKVLQSKLIEDDYLWKILVYGSYLDFNFIKRIRAYKTIAQSVDSKAQGLIVGGGDKNPTVAYKGMPYIKTKQFKPFYIEKNSVKWEKDFAHRNKNIDLFKAPSLLVSKGIDSSLELKVGVLHEDAIFADSITTLKCKSQDMLYSIMGSLYSSFFKYFIINTGSSIGIEREQIHNPEKFSLPYIESKDVIEYSKKLEKYSENSFFENNQNYENLKKELNKAVLETFNLSEEEYALVDYANSVVIPWVIQKKYDVAYKKLAYKDNIIEEYINIFINHYSKIYEQNDMYFKAEVFQDKDKYAIGIYFKVLKEKAEESITWHKEDRIQNFLKFSSNHTLENLFIQKDIKGFEADGFYVIKPNEYKNWHKAIGYLDFYEFRDAILKSGQAKWMN